ncbi:MAG: protoporphyrinogen oxidase [Armatimonadota bacterium]|nr:protoporphyrinogen oxidase [Armatimonadota bacterium]MDR7532874.1 protoporphyrinogen oxidase [Armatimonadota bacterium]MDR7536081.1 protoporphyrinogen oxidase [Armatimonadota bacterium]
MARDGPGHHVVVIGGGIAGLAAAHRLVSDARARDAGVTCTVVEADPRLGGKLHTEVVDGCIVECGPDAFLAAKPWARDLCAALGLADRLIATRPGRGVYVAYRGRLRPLPDGLVLGIPTRPDLLVRAGLLSPADALRAAADLLLPRAREAADEPVGRLLRRRLGAAVVDRLAAPLLAGIYAGDADALSVQATFPQLRQWERRHRSLILAGLAQRRTGRAADEHRQGDGANTPPGAPVFLSLAGGMAELVDALRAALQHRAALLTGTPVVRIVRPDPREAAYALYLGDGRILRAQALVLATPAFVAADLLAGFAPAAAAVLRDIPYASTAAVTLAYRRAEVAHPLDGHGFVVARGEPVQITACSWVSSKWPGRAPPGIALVRCYFGRAGADAIVAADDATLVETARRDLRLVMGLDATPRIAHVARWPHAMPQYTPGHLDRLAAAETVLAGLPHLALAGAGYRGVGVPDCIRQGQEAAAQVLAQIALRPGAAGYTAFTSMR